MTVELSPLTVLIGRSGTGKSNFVRSIRFLRDSLNIRTMKVSEGKGSCLHIDHQKEPIIYDLQFTIPGIDADFGYFLQYNSKTNRYSERLTKSGETLFFHEDGRWIMQPRAITMPKPQGILLGAIPGLQDSTFAYIALKSGIGCYDFPGSVLESTGKNNNPGDNGFADNGDNYLIVAERILTDLSRANRWNYIVKGLKSFNAFIDSLTLNVPDHDRIDIGHRVGQRVITFDARNESDGLRRYLASLLALYQNPSKGVLFFEHPETGLHPAALESLAVEFVRCPQEERGQVILTTHSPQLLDYFPVESLRVVELFQHETKIDRLAPEQVDSLRKKLLTPGELLTVDSARIPGHLEKVSR